MEEHERKSKEMAIQGAEEATEAIDHSKLPQRAGRLGGI